MISSPTVAFLAPMKSELRPLVKKLSLERVERGDAVFHTGKVGEVEVIAGLTGIGMKPAERAAERSSTQFPPDHLVVVGIAGGVPPTARSAT